MARDRVTRIYFGNGDLEETFGGVEHKASEVQTHSNGVHVALAASHSVFFPWHQIGYIVTFVPQPVTTVVPFDQIATLGDQAVDGVPA